MDKKKTIIVSAYFDIGRGKFQIPTCEVRTDSKYIEYFKFWARIKNHLVVYTTERYRDIILEIREGFGLLDKTTVIVMDNIFSVETELYEKMLKISENCGFREIRFFDIATSNRADYDYIMLMKYWCMADVVERGMEADTVIWMDFGFNHGGQVYTDPKEFSFIIEGKTEGKIQLYALPGRNPDKIHSGQSLLLQFDTFNGSLVASPTSLCKHLYKMCKEAMESLISLDCIDDDQQLLFMAYKLHPEYFEVHNAWWFMPLKEYWGGLHLTVKLPLKIEEGYEKKRQSWLDRMLHEVYWKVSRKPKNRREQYVERIRRIVERNH